MNNVKLLHIKCCFFPIFLLSGGIEKYKKNLAPPQEKVEMTLLDTLQQLMKKSQSGSNRILMDGQLTDRKLSIHG